MDNPVFPQEMIDATLEDLVKHYHKLSYTAKEICGFLLFVHSTHVSVRTVYRIMSKLKLKRYNNESQLPHILDKIVHLREQGYSEVGCRSMWRILNTYCGIRATQETGRFALNALDRSSVVRRLNRRLTRRRYCNKGLNFCIHIDGYDKLKPYGISIHGAIDGFSG
ncbi:unnamed protein product [Mytilus coruscus]|uniref:Uncharacterized protein n=1 Tax=Mytilus coruscus TaxID=42192 RepID=A0A6J8AQQ7_MYTCO|nr:unnamed protein product [Mytilus coruscus]